MIGTDGAPYVYVLCVSYPDGSFAFSVHDTKEGAVAEIEEWGFEYVTAPKLGYMRTLDWGGDEIEQWASIERRQVER